MRKYLFEPRFHLVGITALGAFLVVIRENDLPLWLCFVGGVAIAAANDLTQWRSK